MSNSFSDPSYVILRTTQDFKEAAGQPVANTDVPEADLSAFYNSAEDPQYNADIEKYAEQVKDFTARYKGKIGSLDADQLAQTVAEYDAMIGLAWKVMTYTNLLTAKNVDKYQGLSDKTSHRMTEIGNEMVFYSLELAKIPAADLKAKMEQSPALKRYETYLDAVTKSQPYQLSEEVEQALNTAGLSGGPAWVGLFDKLMPSIRYPFRGEQLGENEILNKMYYDPDRATRAEAYEGFKQGLRNNELVLTYITNTLALDKQLGDKLHKYPHMLAARNLGNNIDDKVVEALDNAVTNAYPLISHRFYELKRQMLGVEKLEPYDRNAAVGVEDDSKVTWEQAKKIVLDSYRKFSPEIAGIAQMFFDNKWIDARPTPGKDTGAFSAPMVVAKHPVVYVNFLGEKRDVGTLAHELGHACHQWLAHATGSDILADTPLTLAETASIFGEKLVFEAQLAAEADPSKRKMMLAGKIDDMINSVVRQIAFFNFEKELHQARRDKGQPLETKEINDIFYKTQKDALGPAFELDEGYGQLWSYIPHFIHTPFYVYAYAFGDCLVNSLYEKYQETTDKDDFKGKYINLLKQGGSVPQADALKPFGLDMNDPSFWDAGMKEIEKLIDRLEIEMKNEAALKPRTDTGPSPTGP